MNKYVLIINDGECRAMRFKNSKLDKLEISDMPDDITSTLNKYMVADELDFDLNDPELSRANLEQSTGSLEDKREKMLSDCLDVFLPVLDPEDRLTILASSRYVGKAKEEVKRHKGAQIQVDSFNPSGANKGEVDNSILEKLNSLD